MKLFSGMSRKLFKKLRRYYGGMSDDKFNKVVNLKVGDVIHDCDGFNHKIKSIEFFYQDIDCMTATCSSIKERKNEDKALSETRAFPMKSVTGIKPRKRSRRFVCGYEVIPEGNGCFCECGAFPEQAHSREEIEKYVLSWDCKEGWEIINQGPMNGFGDADNFGRMIEALKNGEHICDENGIKYEKFEPQTGGNDK